MFKDSDFSLRISANRISPTPETISDALESHGFSFRVNCSHDWGNYVVSTMPKGGKIELDVHFIRLGEYIPVDGPYGRTVRDIYKLRGLHPVDPYSLIQANIENPDLSSSCPNATIWRQKAATTYSYMKVACNGNLQKVITVESNIRDEGVLPGNYWLAGILIKHPT